MVRGSGGGVRLLVDMWKTPHRAAGCALCGDVDGRDRRRLRGTAGGAAWKLTHAGGAGEAVAGPWSVKLPGFSGCWESEWRA